MKKYFICSYEGSLSLIAEEDLKFYKLRTPVCLVTNTKEKGARDFDQRKFRVFSNEQGTRFNVFSDNSATEVK